MIIYYAGPKNKAEQIQDRITHCTAYDLINASVPGVTNVFRRRANILAKQIYEPDQLYNHFISHNPDCIAIDEWLWRRFKRKNNLLSAIKKTKQMRPQIRIWLWVGIFTPMRDLLRIAPHVDMILIEQYTAFTCPLLLWFFFKRRYKGFLRHGISDRVMFVLGANKADKLDLGKAIRFQDPNYWLPYAKKDTFKVVIPYIKRECSRLPGIGLYDAGAQQWKIESFLSGVEDANRRWKTKPTNR